MNLLVKKELTQQETEALPFLLKDYPQLLVSSAVVSLGEYAEYFINNIHYLLRQNKKNCLLVVKKNKILGIVLLRIMEWDSNFFKMPIGCIEPILICEEQKDKDGIENILLAESINAARRMGIKILYAPVISEKCSLVNVLNHAGFNLMCGEMRGMLRKRDMPYLYVEGKLNNKYEFRRYRKNDYPQIIRISKEITEDLESKFSLNHYLPQDKRNNYYSESIKNCCLGLNADDIFVATRNGVTRGFICYRRDKIFEKSLGKRMSFLVIGCIARLERRKNLGMHFFAWAHNQILGKSEIILWKIGLHNLPMINFILKRGFLSNVEILYTFCKKL